jgi:hypothetical protein
VLHNDIVLAVLHNAILATEGVVEADVATNVNNAVEKTKATHKNKKTDLDENAQGMPSLSLPSSNPAGNAKSRKDAKGKDNKKDSKHTEPSVKPVKVCFTLFSLEYSNTCFLEIKKHTPYFFNFIFV